MYTKCTAGFILFTKKKEKRVNINDTKYWLFNVKHHTSINTYIYIEYHYKFYSAGYPQVKRELLYLSICIKKLNYVYDLCYIIHTHAVLPSR